MTSVREQLPVVSQATGPDSHDHEFRQNTKSEDGLVNNRSNVYIIQKPMMSI